METATDNSSEPAPVNGDRRLVESVEHVAVRIHERRTTGADDGHLVTVIGEPVRKIDTAA